MHVKEGIVDGRRHRGGVDGVDGVDERTTYEAGVKLHVFPEHSPSPERSLVTIEATPYYETSGAAYAQDEDVTVPFTRLGTGRGEAVGVELTATGQIVSQGGNGVRTQGTVNGKLGVKMDAHVDHCLNCGNGVYGYAIDVALEATADAEVQQVSKFAIMVFGQEYGLQWTSGVGGGFGIGAHGGAHAVVDTNNANVSLGGRLSGTGLVGVGAFGILHVGRITETAHPLHQ